MPSPSPSRRPSPSRVRAHKNRRARLRRTFLAELNFLLEWPLTEADLASHFGVTPGGLSRRIERAVGSEHPLAEQVRRRRPGYCPSCRRSDETHLAGCSNTLPTYNALRARRRRERVGVAS